MEAIQTVKRNPLSRWDFLAGLILLMEMSSLRLMWGVFFGWKLAYLSAAVLGLLSIYGWLYRQQLRSLIQEPILKGWFVFWVIWPFFHWLVGNLYELRQAGLYGFLFGLIIASALWIRRCGPDALTILGGLVFAAEAAGIILSFIAPQQFEGLFQWTGRENTFQGRAFGWALQPNQQARDLVLLFSVWAAFLPELPYRYRLAAYGGLGFLILLTGSRAAFVAALLCFLVYAGRTFFRMDRGRLWICPRPLLTAGISVCLLLTASPLLIRGAAIMIPDYKGTYGILERMDSLLHGKFTQVSQRGESTVEERLSLKEFFFELSAERPLWGYGIGAQERLKKRGELVASSHDQYLMIAFEGGWPLVLFYLFLNLTLHRHPQRSLLERRQRVPFVLQYLLVVFWVGFFTNTLLDSRTYACTTGFLIGLMNTNRPEECR
jgi:O-antigen ligase